MKRSHVRRCDGEYVEFGGFVFGVHREREFPRLSRRRSSAVDLHVGQINRGGGGGLNWEEFCLRI